MKKVILSLMALLMIFVFTACYEGVIDSMLTITSKEGAGTKTLSVKIYKDTAEVPGKPGQTVGNNSKYLPNGLDALVNKLKAECKLEGAVIQADTSNKDYDMISFTYDFKDLADYNTKTKKLANGVEISDATIHVDGNKVTFKEASKNFANSIQWAIDAVYGDKGVYDPKQGDPNANDIKKEEMCKLYDLVVTVGDKSDKIDFAKARLNYEEPAEFIEITGEIASSEAASDAAADTTSIPSPKTGDVGVIFPFLTMIMAGTAVVGLKKRK